MMRARSPDRQGFIANHRRRRTQLVWRRRSGAARAAEELYPLLAHSPHRFLFESARDGEQMGRYSLIGSAPDLLLRVRGGRAELARAPRLTRFRPLKARPLAALRRLMRAQHAICLPPELPMLTAGLFGYLGYDMVREMERLPAPKADPLGLPDALFMRPTRLCVCDSHTGETWLAVLVPPQATPARAWDAAQRQLDEMEAQSRRAALPLARAKASFCAPRSNLTRAAYARMVQRGRKHIIAGDIFQVVLSQRFRTQFALPGRNFYHALKRINPSPYLFFLEFPEFSVIGSSPETLVAVEQRQMRLNVIAGTYRRGRNATEDRKRAAQLLRDEKERAEHLMLLDLGRNDVGRVCEIGSVKPHQPFAIQTTSHLLHLATKITGRLKPDCDALDALIAGFPPGTVSGAPKIRAMEIIHALEPMKRGLYAGGIGYFSASGDMDSCIALRTAILKDRTLYVQAGGGIVYDSDPEREYRECVNKARALFRAAELALDEARR